MAPKNANSPPSHYDGSADVTLLDDGRRVKLLGDFGYLDPQRQRWDVPAGAIVDGASIPRPLWTLIGGPFEGKYRKASIIHDWYCDLRTRAWQSVHRVFHMAMLTSGVSKPQALLLYGGVYWGGPRWTTTVVDNTTLLAEYLKQSKPGGKTFHYPQLHDDHRRRPALRTTTKRFHFQFDDEHLNKLERSLSQGAVSPEDVEAFVDKQTHCLAEIATR